MYSNYATMRFEPEALHGANNGLGVARGLLEKVKTEFPWISYGDLWTLAGVAAVQEMAGPKIPWRPGRIDGFATDATPDGRLPDATQGAPHIRSIFNRMGYGAFPPSSLPRISSRTNYASAASTTRRLSL
jgi:cytochrome c peroxidase